MGSLPEDLNERNLQRWDLSMHENTRQIELDLESNVNVSTIDSWRPPQRETTVGNLSQTGSLGVGQLFELHTLFES